MVSVPTVKPQTSTVVTLILLIRQVHRSAWAVEHIQVYKRCMLQPLVLRRGTHSAIW